MSKSDEPNAETQERHPRGLGRLFGLLAPKHGTSATVGDDADKAAAAAENEMDKLLTLEEAAEILGVEYKTVYRLVRSGKIPAGRVGRQYRLKRTDLDAYFESTKSEVSRQAPIAVREVRCCVTGKKIVSELDIGGYASDTGAPICQQAWETGHRTSAGGSDANNSKEGQA
jgi:excisionase family DNA binding protein